MVSFNELKSASLGHGALFDRLKGRILSASSDVPVDWDGPIYDSAPLVCVSVGCVFEKSNPNQFAELVDALAEQCLSLRPVGDFVPVWSFDFSIEITTPTPIGLVRKASGPPEDGDTVKVFTRMLWVAPLAYVRAPA